jgi:hypothetical protein
MPFQVGRHSRRLLAVVPLALLVFVAVEQVNLGRATNMSRTVEREHLSAVGNRPEECLTFYVAAQPNRVGFEVQVDGMMVALSARIPTLNGHSGSSPAGWDLDPTAADYDQRAETWALNRRIADGLCRVDVTTGTWTVIDVPSHAASRLWRLPDVSRMWF